MVELGKQLPSQPEGNERTKLEKQEQIEKQRLIEDLIESGWGITDTLQEWVGPDSLCAGKTVKRALFGVMEQLQVLGVGQKEATERMLPLSSSNQPNIPEEGNKQAAIEDIVRQGKNIGKLLEQGEISPVKMASVPVIDKNGPNYLTVRLGEVVEMFKGALADLTALGLSEDEARQALGMSLAAQKATVPDASKEALIAEKKRQAENIKAFLKKRGHDSFTKNISIPFYEHGQFSYHIQTKGFVRALHGIYDDLIELGLSKKEALALTNINHYQKPIKPPQETPEENTISNLYDDSPMN